MSKTPTRIAINLMRGLFFIAAAIVVALLVTFPYWITQPYGPLVFLLPLIYLFLVRLLSFGSIFSDQEPPGMPNVNVPGRIVDVDNVYQALGRVDLLGNASLQWIHDDVKDWLANAEGPAKNPNRKDLL